MARASALLSARLICPVCNRPYHAGQQIITVPCGVLHRSCGECEVCPARRCGREEGEVRIPDNAPIYRDWRRAS